jgi:hypothetical protein
MGVFVGTTMGVDVGNGVSVGTGDGVGVGGCPFRTFGSTAGNGAAQASAAQSNPAAASSTAFLDLSIGRMDRIGDGF